MHRWGASSFGTAMWRKIPSRLSDDRPLPLVRGGAKPVHLRADAPQMLHYGTVRVGSKSTRHRPEEGGLRET